MTHEQAKIVLQKKMDTLSAKHLHEIYLSPLQKWNNAIDALAIAVPILFLTARVLIKGSPFIDGLADVSATALLVLSIIKIIYKWQDKAVIHSRLRDENISLGTQADAITRKGDAASSDSVEMFLQLVDRSEQADRESCGTIKPANKRKAYREALKEVDPGSTTTRCPFCNASPWVFKSGTCQVCGNTPVTK